MRPVETAFSDGLKHTLESNERTIIDAWKLYILNLILHNVPSSLNKHSRVRALAVQVRKMALKSEKKGLLDTLRHAFTRTFFPVTLKGRIVTPSTSAEVHAEYPPFSQEADAPRVPYSELFEGINDILSSHNPPLKVWLLLDRLDEAFPGKPDLERKALRALMQAYKDLMGLENIRIKIFIRDDIYKRITSDGGFAALTHINSRASVPVQWDPETLLYLLVQRVFHARKVVEHYNVNPNALVNVTARLRAFYTVFEKDELKGRLLSEPKDNGTYAWIIESLTDGNGVITPRDMIELVRHARQFQLDMYARDAVDESAPSILSNRALERALELVSKDKIENMILAEYNHLRRAIEVLRDGSDPHPAEKMNSPIQYSHEELATLLGVREATADVLISEFTTIGLLKKIPTRQGRVYAIPILYRTGLGRRV